MDKKIESGTEFVTERKQTVWNLEGGTIASNGNTGEEKLHISHPSGANLNFNNKTVSLFAPNNAQELVHGNKYQTTAGDAFSTTNSNKEERAHGDFTIITGSPSFFSDTIAEEWLTANNDIAAIKAAPEYTYHAIGNNTDIEYQEKGTPNPDSGAVEGGSYEPSTEHADVPAVLEEKAGEIADIERRMGPGGSLKMMSAKHVYLQAGPKAVTFDSGVIVPKGKSVTQKYVVEDGEVTEVQTSVPVYESKDTSSSVPFGDVHVSAATKINMNSGSGGVSIKSAGETNINTTGRLMLGGAEVAIGGSTLGGSGRVTIITDRDVYIDSNIITMNSKNVNISADDQITFITGDALFTGDLQIAGNLKVEGSIVAEKDITAGGSSGVSLLKHTHNTSGVESGGSTRTSSKPN